MSETKQDSRTNDTTWFERLEVALESRGMTKYALAQALGVDPSRFSHWKNGRGLPDLYIARDIADLLDLPPDYLSARGKSVVPPPPARSAEERILLDAVRDIGPLAALRILVAHGVGQAVRGDLPAVPTPIRSVEVKHGQGKPPKAT